MTMFVSFMSTTPNDRVTIDVSRIRSYQRGHYNDSTQLCLGFNEYIFVQETVEQLDDIFSVLTTEGLLKHSKDVAEMIVKSKAAMSDKN